MLLIRPFWKNERKTKVKADKNKTDIEEYECEATQTQEEDLKNVDVLVFRDTLIIWV